jgi:hypothetical protein
MVTKMNLILILISILFLNGCLTDSFTVNNSNLTTEDGNIDPPVIPPVEPPVTPPEAGLVPGFVSVGHLKSTMYSCDGTTWKGYRTANASLRCWDNSQGNFDCDHSPTSSMGVAYGPAGFMATYGWGQAGQVELSNNATTWSVVQSGGTWAGIAYGNNTYILNERSPLVSSDSGQNWIRGGDINFIPWNARKISFINLNGGLFISTANSSGTMDLMISRNNGASFSRPTTLPASCGEGFFANNNTTILLLSESLCRSTDFGQTWQVLTKPASGSIIFDGSEFKIFDIGKVYRSSNGTTWTQTTLQLNGVNTASLSLSNVAYHSESHKYVAINQSWQAWYEQTEFYRSDNGVNWIRLNKSAGDAPTNAHPVKQITAGYLPATSCD